MAQQRKQASIMSAVVMGLGQIFNGQWLKGILLLAIYAGGVWFMINNLYDAVWGIVTLGDTPLTMNEQGEFEGHHSINLLLDGLISLLVVLIFLIIYFFNIKDAYNNGKLIDEGKAVSNIVDSIKYVFDKKFPHFLLTLPGIGLLFLTIMPIIFSIMIAFTNYAGPDHLPPANLVDWAGFDTFKDLLVLKSWQSTFFGVLTWTFIWAFFSTVTCYFGGLLVALLIQQPGIKFKALWRTIYIIPYAIPQFISLLIWRNLLNGEFGPINDMIIKYFSVFGLEAIPWLSDPFWAKVSLIVVNMWIGIPVSMVLTIGVLTTIPRDLYEAAEVDGATAFQKFRLITLPLVLFATAPILITQFAGNINNFNIIYLLTKGEPQTGDYQFAGETDILVSWLFKLAFDGQSRYNMASAVGIIIFVIIATLSIISYRNTKSFKEEDMIQ